MAISYTRTFSHTDWVDNVDRVQAGGDSGLNGRFHGLEAELDAIASTFAQVAQAISALSVKPPPTDVKLTLAPTLATVGAAGWEQTPGSVSKPPGATSANGVMSIALPQAATLKSLRAVGQNSGSGVLVVQLRAQALAVGAPSQLIVSVGGSGGGFDTTNAVPATATPVVDNTQLRYYLQATLSGASASDTVSLEVVQITYQPGS